jgi:hypothetical protein
MISGSKLASPAVPPPLPPANREVRVDVRVVDAGEELPAATFSDVLKSRTTASVVSSLLFHLTLWGLVALMTAWLGVDWSRLLDNGEPPLQAALGDVELLDDLPAFDMAGEVELDMQLPASRTEQLAQQLQQSDNAWLNSSLDDAWQNMSDAEDGDEDGSGILLKVPKSGLAVTKGSFTAFTIPAHPKPRETYMIVIEVRLKDDVKRYRVSDLTGEVRGTDNYTQKLPCDSRFPNASRYPVEGGTRPLKSSTILDVIDNRVQIMVAVPGAARLVRDRITLKSRRLKEEQELTLVFGQNPDDDVSPAPGQEQPDDP